MVVPVAFYPYKSHRFIPETPCPAQCKGFRQAWKGCPHEQYTIGVAQGSNIQTGEIPEWPGVVMPGGRPACGLFAPYLMRRRRVSIDDVVFPSPISPPATTFSHSSGRAFTTALFFTCSST